MKKVLIVVLSVLMTLSLFGCGNKNEKLAQQTVTEFTKAISKADFEKASKYYQGDISDFEIDIEVENVYKLLLSKLSCKTLSTEKISDNKVVVTTEFTNIACGKIVGDFTKQYLSWALSTAFSTDKPDQKAVEKKMKGMFTDSYKMYKNEKVTTECEVIVVKEDGKWVVSNQNIMLMVDAVFGGIDSALGTLGGSLFQ